jgi:hypothetical protein
VVTQIKKDKTDGYKALQLGFGVKKEQKPTSRSRDISKKRRSLFFYTERSRTWTTRTTFPWVRPSARRSSPVGEKVNVTGKSKGRGFLRRHEAPWIWRWPETHGSHSHRTARFHRLQRLAGKGHQGKADAWTIRRGDQDGPKSGNRRHSPRRESHSSQGPLPGIPFRNRND